MIHEAIVFDSAMTAGAALERLAHYGIWLDPMHPAASKQIVQRAKVLDIGFDEAAKTFSVPEKKYRAAIRRQWRLRVLWYQKEVEEVLGRCMHASPTTSLLDALDLHEYQSIEGVQVGSTNPRPGQPALVLDGSSVVGVDLPFTSPPSVVAVPRPLETTGEVFRGGAPMPSPAPDVAMPPKSRGGWFKLPTRSAKPANGGFNRTTATRGEAAAPVQLVEAWPNVESPASVSAGQLFDVRVGLAAKAQAATGDAPIRLKVEAPDKPIALDIELISYGVEFVEGSSRRLYVNPRQPLANYVSFKLRALAPGAPDGIVTTIEVRYVRDGTICGVASRPLIVSAANVPQPPASEVATVTAANPPASSGIALDHVDPDIDLTIEFAKPDTNDAVGRFACKLYSRHPITVNRGPHDVDLGEDAKSFAKALIDDVRVSQSNQLISSTLGGFGSLISEKLPQAALDALAQVAQIVQPRPPVVLIASVDPYVPWELAKLDPPLDATRPPYLGAQAIVGRWLRPTRQNPNTSVRPPVNPPAKIAVRDTAVVGGFYGPLSRMRNLPQAEAEAKTLAAAWGTDLLAATPAVIQEIITARIRRANGNATAADIIHFAGHGEFNAGNADSSVLFLSDGTPVKSMNFRDATYGGSSTQPLIFFNACMIGTGGELLGDMGGFPGNCLRGGFGGVLGALWEVDDTDAHDLAVEFWRRARPAPGGTAEPVGAIMRDLRAKYASTGRPIPAATYLAYVYFGHPTLTLQ